MINHASFWGLPRTHIGGCWLHARGSPYSFWFKAERDALHETSQVAMMDDTPRFIGRFRGNLSNE